LYITLSIIFPTQLISDNRLKSYLKARRQNVVIKNNSSAYCEISAGVPQCSVLEPILFNIYINDIAATWLFHLASLLNITPKCL
jgi:hypothetical protein